MDAFLILQIVVLVVWLAVILYPKFKKPMTKVVTDYFQEHGVACSAEPVNYIRVKTFLPKTHTEPKDIYKLEAHLMAQYPKVNFDFELD